VANTHYVVSEKFTRAAMARKAENEFTRYSAGLAPLTGTETRPPCRKQAACGNSQKSTSTGNRECSDSDRDSHETKRQVSAYRRAAADFHSIPGNVRFALSNDSFRIGRADSAERRSLSNFRAARSFPELEKN